MGSDEDVAVGFQPVLSSNGQRTAEPSGALPFYVREALADLTPAQKKYVLAGCLHGDFTMTMARTLQRKALFYLHIDSPNGRYGTLRLTPLGVTVQGILKARAAPPPQGVNATGAEAFPDNHLNEGA